MDAMPQKLVKDVVTRAVISIDAEESVKKAGELMDAKNVSMLVVNEKEKVVGVLTAGDWFKSFYLHVGGHLPNNRFRTERAAQTDLQQERMGAVKKRAAEFKQIKVRDVMNPHFRTIDENTTLMEAAHEMKASELRRLLVTDSSGKIIGVLGRTKTINAILEEL